MGDYRVIEVKRSVLEGNDREAEALRARNDARGLCLVNLMGSPGAGKTTLLARTVRHLAAEMRIGVMEADIDADVDAARMAATGARTIQLHTGGMCHLDAAMCAQGLDELGAEGLDLVFLENVGNLVCPAEFDTGATVSAMVLSVPEGDDKPLKYPLMFEVCDLVVVSKTDVAPYFDFDFERFRANVAARNPDAVVLPLSAKAGENMHPWYEWLRTQVASVR